MKTLSPPGNTTAAIIGIYLFGLAILMFAATAVIQAQRSSEYAQQPTPSPSYPLPSPMNSTAAHSPTPAPKRAVTTTVVTSVRYVYITPKSTPLPKAPRPVPTTQAPVTSVSYTRQTVPPTPPSSPLSTTVTQGATPSTAAPTTP